MPIANKKKYLAEIKSILRSKWPGNRTVNIVCHGHSVPSGYFKTPVVNTFNSYPHLLHLALKKKYPFAVVNVIVTAIGGESSKSGSKRFKKDVLKLKPDVVTIDYSLNDRGLGLPVVKKYWSSMIKAAKTAGVKVILLSPTGDWTENLKDKKNRLNLHGAQVEALAKKYNTGFVDSLNFYRSYIKSGKNIRQLLSQINHPNAKAHKLVAKELAGWF
ncbi:MAG: lipase [Candidatus Firestonebacteria bacterium RIFOXYA2_FULL_40_8]|nr:MAG: lipase [Candidatus Firestonebacteria bacterium RIFOXYA2_FULL_40_8]